MNGNARWPTEKGGHQQGLHGQWKRAETTSGHGRLVSAGHVALLFICFPGLPLQHSIHLSPRSVAAGARPFP